MIPNKNGFTIYKELLKKNSKLILLSHLGRPKGIKEFASLSLV